MRPRNLLLVSAALAVGIATYALLAPSGLPKLRAKQQDLQKLQADVALLERDNALLLSQASSLRDDAPEAAIYLEDAAREELGWVRPDEHVLLLSSGAEDERAAADGAQREAP